LVFNIQNLSKIGLNVHMTSVAFGLEVVIHKIHYLKMDAFPSLALVVEKNPLVTLIPYSREAHDGDKWREERMFQFMYVVDAFESCVSWPVSLELVSPFELTALGQCTYEVKPLICDAIAAQGSSPLVKQAAPLRNFTREQVARVDFDMRVVFFRMTRKRAAIEKTLRKGRGHAVDRPTVADVVTKDAPQDDRTATIKPSGSQDSGTTGTFRVPSEDLVRGSSTTAGPTPAASLNIESK
jgi:hypothetical protein